MSYLHIQGFSDNRRSVNVFSDNLYNSRFATEGYTLDEFHINASITSKDDIDNLIKLLAMTKFCFRESKCKCNCK